MKQENGEAVRFASVSPAPSLFAAKVTAARVPVAPQPRSRFAFGEALVGAVIASALYALLTQPASPPAVDAAPAATVAVRH